MTTKFNVGDVVQLKSGGPPMTVTGHPTRVRYSEEDADASCVWFEKASLGAATFPEQALHASVAFVSSTPRYDDDDDLSL